MAVKATAEITLRDQTDAEAIILWHYVSTSATKPNKPNTTSASATPSGWSKSEPSVSSDSDLSKYDYTSLQTVWGDGTCDWGDVNLSASYEAAKRAWNKAGSVENQLNNLEIGGRNLLLGSDKNTISGTGSINKGGYGLSVKIPKGTTVVVSVQIDADDVSWANSGSRRLGFELTQATDGVASGTQYIGVWWGYSGTTNNGAGISYVSSDTSFHGRIWATYTLTRDFDSYEVQPNRWGIYIQNLSGGTVTVSKPKIEIGNKATDWTPAPEDVTNDINTVSTAMSEANEGLADSIAEVSRSLEDTNTRLIDLTQAVRDADADRAKWIRADDRGLTIGAVDSDYNLVLDNNSVDFKIGDQLAATASVDAFIPTALRLGDYVLSGSGGYLYIDYQPLT